MNQFYSTRAVAGFLHLKPDTLQKAIWQNRVTPPPKSPGGQYLWTIAYIESAAWAMGRFEQFKIWEKGRTNE
jgi:hypothetical protein